MSRAREAPRRHSVWKIVGKFFRDERARSVTRGQIALRQQLLIRQQRGCSRHAQILRERARGRKPRPGTEHAVEDRPPNGGIHLLLQPFACASVDANQEAGREARQVVIH